jgi:hypothetical protein
VTVQICVAPLHVTPASAVGVAVALDAKADSGIAKAASTPHMTANDTR